MNVIALDNSIKPIDAGACARTIKVDIHFEIHSRSHSFLVSFKLGIFPKFPGRSSHGNRPEMFRPFATLVRTL